MTDQVYPDHLRYHEAHDWVDVDGDDRHLRYHLVCAGHFG